jgi:Immunity protein 51
MGNFASVMIIDGHDTVTVYMTAESDKTLEIGDRMYKMHPDAYMNGPNWEAFMLYYCGKMDPDALKGIETDSEAGTFVAYYPLNPENEARATRFVALINGLMSDEERLYALLKAEGHLVHWD